jgi:hypothetical protein
LEETLEAKKCFERFCDKYTVSIHQYHPDHGRFTDNAFRQHAQENNQRITYCGVNAHFQNCTAEKRIQDLQDQATAMLMHATTKWPAPVSVNLWPYALREANEAINSTQTE